MPSAKRGLLGGGKKRDDAQDCGKYQTCKIYIMKRENLTSFPLLLKVRERNLRV